MAERSSLAVVAGLDLNGLGVVRALGRAGIPVLALDTEFDKPTAATRFGNKVLVSTLSGPGFIDALLSLRQRFDRSPVLILTQEASVLTVSLERERLAGAYLFTMPPHALMADLLDKLRFQALAEGHGFPIPRAVRITRAQGPEVTRGLRFPCVLKPTHKHAGYAKRFVKAYKVVSEEEVAGLWSQMQDVVDELIVQEWIEGNDSDVFFCLQYRPRSGAATSFAGRKTCQWPPLIGGTATCVPAPEAAEELTALTDGFFDAVGFTGIGSMEYKRDPRDGRFYMVEPTVGRTDYQEEIAVLNGVNIPLAVYCGELGLEPPAVRKAHWPHAWRDPMGHGNALKAGANDPIATIAPGIKISDAYFRTYDPMPYIALKLEALRRRFALSGRNTPRNT